MLLIHWIYFIIFHIYLTLQCTVVCCLMCTCTPWIWVGSLHELWSCVVRDSRSYLLGPTQGLWRALGLEVQMSTWYLDADADCHQLLQQHARWWLQKSPRVFPLRRLRSFNVSVLRIINIISRYNLSFMELDLITDTPEMQPPELLKSHSA